MSQRQVLTRADPSMMPGQTVASGRGSIYPCLIPFSPFPSRRESGRLGCLRSTLTLPLQMQREELEQQHFGAFGVLSRARGGPFSLRFLCATSKRSAVVDSSSTWKDQKNYLEALFKGGCARPQPWQVPQCCVTMLGGVPLRARNKRGNTLEDCQILGLT